MINNYTIDNIIDRVPQPCNLILQPPELYFRASCKYSARLDELVDNEQEYGAEKIDQATQDRAP